MNLAVKTDRLGKTYRLYPKPTDRLKEWATLGALRRHRLFTALEDVSFELPKGRALGIIGPNGAGKSTLLKILCGTSAPTSGAFAVNGRLAALLELGAGFHPDFTGHENIKMNGLLLGLSPEEIAEATPRIAEFSELGDFLDQPVRTYSSGMQVRLGFSIAACTQPDILVVDEALAVGDEHFRHKSLARLEDFRKDGATLLFVSHDFSTVRELCDEAIFLETGRVVMQGPVDEVTLGYLNRVHFMEEESRYAINRRTFDKAGLRFGTGEIEIERVTLRPESGDLLHPGEAAQMRIEYKVNQTVGPVNFGFNIFRADGVHCVGTNQAWADGTRLAAADLPPPGSHGVMRWRFEPLLLLPGDYSLSVSVYQDREGDPMPLDEVLHILRFRVERAAADSPLGTFLQPGRWEAGA